MTAYMHVVSDIARPSGRKNVAYVCVYVYMYMYIYIYIYGVRYCTVSMLPMCAHMCAYVHVLTFQGLQTVANVCTYSCN